MAKNPDLLKALMKLVAVADEACEGVGAPEAPQNGLTERSLSLYLSMCDAGEVTPRWLSTPFPQHDSMNLLLVPWPNEVLVSQFRDVTDNATTELPDGFGFFTYDILGGDDLFALVGFLHAEATRKLGRIDGVVLPELSITDEQFRGL